MPIYEYKCDSCHYRFEKKQGFHDKPEAVCPKCQGKAHRVIHPAPVIFKGSGFYVTDSRKGVKGPAEAEKKPHKEEKAK
jgi:putative FmdB family regulatory protein